MWTSFIGFMGSGKSTLTRRLQEQTNRPRVELDELVCARAGRSVPEIFAAEGEEGFRARELEALAGLDPARNLLVDTGGGLVETPGAGDLLRSRGVVIWLDGAWEALRVRLEEGASARPLVDALGWEGLAALYRRRRGLYAAAADFRLRSDLGGVDQLARRAMLRGLLWQRREMG